MSDLAWSSALSADPPPIPRRSHWTAGMVVSGAMCFSAAAWYAALDHSVLPLPQEDEERVIVALGGAAPRKIEAPPSPPKGTPTVDKPPVVAERAKDAAPIAPPPEPRPVLTWTQGTGDFSSGTGGTAKEPSPPAPPAPPAPPPPPVVDVPAAAGVAFDTVSTARYMALLRYPQQSLNDHEEGVGLLLVTITKQGAVLGWSLNQSTGYGRLDREIRRVADKVKRLDPLPADFPRNRAIVRVRIIFHVVAPEG